VNDADLTFENYKELFGTSHIQTEQLFDDAGIDSYFEMKEMLPADSNSNEVCVFLFVCSFFFPCEFIVMLFVGNRTSVLNNFPIIFLLVKGSPSTAAKLLPFDHEVMGPNPGNSFLQKCKERLHR
jgi:hypothetical protein